MAQEGTPPPDWFNKFREVNKAPAPAPPPAAAPRLPPQSPGDPKEKRKFPRFEVSQVICRLYRKGLTSLVGLSRLNIEATAVDLSEGGVRISVRERLLADARIHLRLEIVKFKDVLESDGIVRWCREVPGSEPKVYHAGISFVHLDATQMKKITSMRVYFSSVQDRRPT